MSIRTRFHPHSEGGITVHRWDDVEPAIELNKTLQTMPQKSESFHHIASIPAIILERWMNEDGVNLFELPKHEFARYVRRKLNDPDWMHLRVTHKRF